LKLVYLYRRTEARPAPPGEVIRVLIIQI